MQLTEGQERYAFTENGNLNFNILLTMKINVKNTYHYKIERLPERYNTEDNLVQFMQLIAGDLLSYCLAGAIKPGYSFLVAGYVPDSEIWPVFACALENINSNSATIVVKTFMTWEREKVFKRRKMSDIFFCQNNGLGGENREHVIIGNPYANNGGNMEAMRNGTSITSCAKVSVTCGMSQTYVKGEEYVFKMPQKGRSAMGFIRKGAKYIINAILNGTISKGDFFYIESANPIEANNNRHSFCELRYSGVKIHSSDGTKEISLYANRLSTDPRRFVEGIPCVGVIDTGEKFVKSSEHIKRIENLANKNIGTGALDKDAMNFEKGEDFKLDPKFRSELDRKMMQLKKDNDIKSSNVTINENKLSKMISNIIMESLDEYYENGPYTHSVDLGDDDAYKDNGRSSKWVSPKGDFRTVSESRLRKMIAESINKVIKEYVEGE